MVPFRVYDRENKSMLIVVNYHPGSAAGDKGTYLVAKEDDTDLDGELKIMSVDEISKLRLVDFLDEGELPGE